MGYKLKNDNEFNRLEYQSNNLPNYNFKEELKGFTLQDGEVLLDAACGSGVVSRYMAATYPNSSVLACDIGEENLQKAQEKARNLNNLKFSFQDITSLSYKDNFFDKIICRYAIQHVEKDYRQTAINEFYRCLKPGGTLTVIDFDGTLHNIYPRPKEIDSILNKIELEEIIDLRIGRKLPKILLNANFSNVRQKVSALTFTNEGLEQEIFQMEQRLSNAKPFLIETIGNEKEADNFKEKFLTALKAPGTTYFYNKFVVSGRKEGSLKIVKEK